MAVETKMTLAQEIRTELDENVNLCYQCVKCTSGCPLADEYDLTPNQVLRALQLGEDDRVLNSRTIWLCASCHACVTRCPQQIDLPRINDWLAIRAQKLGLPAKIPQVPTFRKVFLRNVAWLGRAYELGLIAEMNLRTLQPLKDVGMGLEMLKKGKVKVLPNITRPAKTAPPVPQKENLIGYYPGCSLHSLSSELDHSALAVLKQFGLETYTPKGWSCCGSSPAHSTDHLLATSLPIRNLSLFEQAGFQEVLAPCIACYSRFKSAQVDMARHPELKQQVEEKIGRKFEDRVKVKSLLDVLIERVGYDAIAQKVTRPLRDLKAVSYYGCLITRPTPVTGAEHPENPVVMDRIVERLGASPVDWSFKTECCGGSLSLTRTDIMLKLTRKILEDAQAVGADLVVTACPLCHVNLDARQAALNLEQPIPVLFVTQLMGLAYGLDPHALALDKNMVDTRALVARIRDAVPA